MLLLIQFVVAPRGVARGFIMLKPTKTFEELLLYFSDSKNKGADQTASMSRLVCAFFVCKQQSKGFSR